MRPLRGRSLRRALQVNPGVMRIERWAALGVVVALLGPTAACVGACDIFNRRSQSLPGGYCLELDREFDLYRVQDCSGRRKVSDGVGVLEGTIQEIGWNASVVIASRESCCGAGDGFMLIDIASDKIEGPFSREAIEKRIRIDTRLRGITIRPARDHLQ